MIIYKCDICKKEIQDMQHHGEFQLMEKAFTFTKHKGEEQIRKMLFLLCSECGEKIKQKIQELQKQVGTIIQ